MEYVTDVAEIEALYGTPSEASLLKVATALTPTYRTWIERSRFCVLSTVGPEGVDGTPRGDEGPVVRELDERTLAMPDWRGNNRMDSLRNIVRDPRVSLMFFIPGSTNVVRVIGEALVTCDSDLCESFTHKGKAPRSVIVITIAEVYVQCARALMRSELWSGEDQTEGLPTIGEILKEMSSGEFDHKAYDAEWAGRAAATMW